MLAFAESLTARSAAQSAGPLLLRERPTRLWAIDATRAGLAAARAVGRASGTEVERLDFRMIDVRDEAGLLIRLRLSYFDLARVQDDLLAQPAFRAWLDAAPDRLGAYLAKCASDSATDGTLRLWRAMYLVQVARWRARREGDREPVLLLEDRPFFSAVQRYAAAEGVRVVPAPARLSAKAALQAGLGAGAAAFLRRARSHGLKAALSSPARPAASSGRARVAAEYYGQLNLDEAACQSNLFFAQRSALPRDRTLVLFGLVNDPLTPARLAETRRHGMEALAIHPAAASDPSLPLFESRARPATVPAPAGARGAEGRWLRARAGDYARRRAFWGDLCRRHDIRLLVSWYRFDESHCAAADGVADAGGVHAIYQRAHEALSNRNLRVDTDLHFSFSAESARLCAADGSRARYNIVTGYLNDHLFASARPVAAETRRALEANGARKVVALFDENSADDARWQTGHELQRSDYRLLLEKVLELPWLGLVVKPKVPATLRRRLGPVAELLAKAEATGRCKVFQAGPVFSAYPPAAAALAADAVVHGHLCAATAGMEAALAGVPTLLVDQEGWAASPLYELGEGKVVFRDWEAAWAALSEHLRRDGGVPGLGDWSALLPRLDPFRDGRAAERMGTFLAWVLEGFDRGLDRDAAMAAAAERYAEAWGAERVLTIGGGRAEPALGAMKGVR